MEIKKCTTLEEARNEIDSVDKEIVELIAKRNEYIKQIAHFKTSVEEVKAEERIADVIAHVREQAISLELSPNLINDLYVRMIDEIQATQKDKRVKYSEKLWQSHQISSHLAAHKSLDAIRPEAQSPQTNCAASAKGAVESCRSAGAMIPITPTELDT